MARADQVPHGHLHGQICRLLTDRPPPPKDESGRSYYADLPAGTIVKVVMVSRLGDCGVTTNLDAESGYTLRVQPEELELVPDEEDFIDDAPHVCPGCHAVGEEPCAPGCIDAEIAADRSELDAFDDEDEP